MKLQDRINYFLHEKGGLKWIMIIAVLGLCCTVIGFFGLQGFSILGFIFFRLPLYILCGWLVYKFWKFYKRLKG